MDAPVTIRRGETETHVRLKRLAMVWAQAHGYSACAAEVKLPQCRYRADVAAYRARAKEPGQTAIFECKQALPDLRRDNVAALPRGNGFVRLPDAARFWRNISASIIPRSGRATRFSQNTIRTISPRSGTAITAASCANSRRCKRGCTVEGSLNASSAIVALTCFIWSCLTSFAMRKRPSTGASWSKQTALSS